MGLSTNWDLTKLYPSFESDEFKRDMKRVKEGITEAEEWAQLQLNDTANVVEKLGKMIDIAEEQMTLHWRLGSYAQLTLATDATNETALGMLDRLERVVTQSQVLLSKFTRFLGGVENLQSVIDSSEKLKEFDYYLNEVYKESKHLLSDDVEKAVAELSLTGGNAWSRMRDMIDGTT